MKLHPATLQFLDAIADHNTRTFFATVRPLYDEILDSIHDLCTATIHQISTFDTDIKGLTPKDCLFRIYRDARRLKEGDQLYKHNRGFVISPGGKKSSLPGYYLHIEPGNKSFFASGVYRPETGELKKLRERFHMHGAAYKKIITTSAFKKMFGAVTGSKTSRPPKGFTIDDPYIDLIMRKQHLIYRHISDKEIMDIDIVKRMTESAHIAFPWVQFLRDGME